MKSPEDMSRVVETYADMVRRICLVHLKNIHDTEDVFQNVFMKYMLYKGVFEDGEHEKAWFVRVTINACTDWLRSLSRRRWLPLEEVLEESGAADESSQEVLEAVLQLPDRYRQVIYLFYFEGYSAVEIAGILGKRRIRSTPGFPGQRAYCGKSWEVSGHEQDS